MNQSALVKIAYVLLSTTSILFFVIGSSSFSFYSRKLRNLIERNQPFISVMSRPQGIHEGLSKLILHISDEQSGIGALEATFNSTNKSSNSLLNEKNLDVKKLDVEFLIPGKLLNLTEASAEFSIKVSDKSLSKNSNKQLFQIQKDVQNPVLKIESQHTFSEFDLLKIKATDNISISEVGLKFTNLFLPAQTATTASREYYLLANRDFLNINNSQSRIYAQDSVRNATFLPFSSEEIPQEDPVELKEITSSAMVEGIVSPVRANSSLINIVSKLYDQKIADISVTRNRATFAEYSPFFEVYNSYLVNFADRELKAMLAQTRETLFWDSPFLTPEAKKTYDTMSTIIFKIGETQFPQIKQDFSVYEVDESQQEVPVVQDGIVNYIGNCTIMKTCLAINHGLGIASVYGFLEEIKVKPGDKVNRGQAIAHATRLSGLYQARESNVRGYALQILLHGRPIKGDTLFQNDFHQYFQKNAL
jgi:murein DD-endopeptidase MepM/ murein hydrolase activator NlpD